MKFTRENQPVEPVDYLAIGHVSQDITPDGLQLGGTVSFAGLTALAFGLRVGIVTAAPKTLDFTTLERIDLMIKPSPEATIFENIQSPLGRVQMLHSRAAEIRAADIPEVWRKSGIVHLGPLCRELEPETICDFRDSFIGVTPQGWMRTWDDTGRVTYGDWSDADTILEKASAIIISAEDVHHDENRIETLIPLTHILVVTEGASGARVYWNGDIRRINAPKVELVESTGAGDIFAAAFFIRLHQTRDPWEAARLAVRIASNSVTRFRLNGAPTPEEVQAAMSEVISD